MTSAVRVDDATSPRANRRPRLGNIPALTGLRGIAVLLVIMLHSGPLTPEPIHGTLAYSFLQGGFLGVDLFFALSGFLITSLLLEERGSSGRVSYRNFYARRALRLLPALYAMLATYAVYSYVASLDAYRTRTTIIWAVCYATNFQALLRPGTMAIGLGHLWSLAIEEQFYLVWPVVFVTALRFTKRAAPLVLGLLVAIYVVFLNRFALHVSGQNPLRIFLRLDTRADELLIGALAAVLWYFRKEAKSRWFEVLGWAGVSGFVACMFMDSEPSSFWDKGGFTIVGISATAMVVAAVSGQWSARHALSWKPLLILGQVSYGLYLWHFPIFKAVEAHDAGWPWFLRMSVAWGLAAAATAASWFLVERPANRLKRHFSRAPVAAPSESLAAS
jgi:peptidoglycan/LPS O-acetylase OafA/YrhL